MDHTTKIVMKNISVEFPGVKALQNVDYCFESGRVMALVGANGAGKSTLMKVLSGVYDHYEGEIFVDDIKVEIRHPNQAKDLGIETVYQEIDTILVSNLTVAENIMMDYVVRGIGRKQFINWKYIQGESKKILQELGINVSVNQLVESLSMAQKQMIVIARAVLRKCKFLILDEPTAPLSDNETEKLFTIVRKLREDGVGIIFISHRLNELFEICESLTILRDGKIVVSHKELNADTTINDIVEKMLGRSYCEKLDTDERNLGDILLQTKDFSEKTGLVKNINMYVRSGEIIGLSGLVGAGKTELCKTIFGAFGPADGTIQIKGKTVKIKIPKDAVSAGIAFIPEERRKEGIVIGESVSGNLSISTLGNYTNSFSFINRKHELETANKKIKELNIVTPSPQQKIEYLSGGNQQKVTIGKWIDSTADIYIFDEATKGIDVGAKQDVYKLIVKLARAGKAIIYSTSEQNEILLLTDRVYTMYDGKINCEFNTCDVSEERLMLYSTGGCEA